MGNKTTAIRSKIVSVATPGRKMRGSEAARKTDPIIEKNGRENSSGTSIEEFEKRRDEILKKVEIPEHLKGLTLRELRDLAVKEAFGA